MEEKSLTIKICKISRIVMICVVVIFFLLYIFESEENPYHKGWKTFAYSLNSIVGIIALSLNIYYKYRSKFKTEVRIVNHKAVAVPNIYATFKDYYQKVSNYFRKKDQTTNDDRNSVYTQDQDSNDQLLLGTANDSQYDNNKIDYENYRKKQYKDSQTKQYYDPINHTKQSE